MIFCICAFNPYTLAFYQMYARIIPLLFYVAILSLAGITPAYTSDIAMRPVMNDGDNTSPSAVYQEIEELRFKLTDLGLINKHKYDTDQPDTLLRHPRHVIQKARECHQIISKILVARHIKPEPMPGLYSFHEIRPSDVKNSVEHLLKEVSKLGKTPTRAIPFTEGKLSVDAFNGLKRICQAINVEITPADIYQVAIVVEKNMERIATSQQYDLDIPQSSFESKTLDDVYAEAWGVLDSLRTLALNPDYAIPGGIIIPNSRQKGQITPGDVIDLVNDLISGTNAIKYTLDIREETPLPPYQSGKTASDVYNVLYRTHLITQKILALETELDHEDDQ